MKLEEYLDKNRHDDPPRGTVGVESDWLPFCDVQVPTGRLWAGDPYTVNADAGFALQVPSGTYLLEAKVMDFAGRKRISRLRVYQQAVKTPGQGKQIGHTCTDIARIAVCDIGALDAAIAGEKDRFFDLVKSQNFQDCGIARLQMKDAIAIPYVSTGFGDSEVPVFALKSGRRRIGIELEFLPPDYAYEEEEDNEGYTGPGTPPGIREDGSCVHCGNSGLCYCLRKGSKTPEGCVRCGGTGRCHICGGRRPAVGRGA